MPLLAALLVLLFGCASSSPPSQKTVDWFDTQATYWVQGVMRGCKQTHRDFKRGTSKVDCTYDYPTVMKMSFPTQASYARNREEVAIHLANWCRAVSIRSGKSPRVELVFRDEAARIILPCLRSQYDPQNP